jgi:hypothetical protein
MGLAESRGYACQQQLQLGSLTSDVASLCNPRRAGALRLTGARVVRSAWDNVGMRLRVAECLRGCCCRGNENKKRVI